MNIVGTQHLVGHIALVEIHMRPLSTLRLVARDCVAIFYLQGVEMFVLA